MNKVVLMGRLTKDPDIRYLSGDTAKPIASFTLAVSRRSASKGGRHEADFINCISRDRNAEFAEKAFRKGMRVIIGGHIHTWGHVNFDGERVHETEVVVEDQEIAESKLL